MTAHQSGGREKDLPSASAGVSRIAVSVTESESYRQSRTIMKKSLSSASVGVGYLERRPLFRRVYPQTMSGLNDH
jgi:hypothetical protein